MSECQKHSCFLIHPAQASPSSSPDGWPPFGLDSAKVARGVNLWQMPSFTLINESLPAVLRSVFPPLHNRSTGSVHACALLWQSQLQWFNGFFQTFLTFIARIKLPTDIQMCMVPYLLHICMPIPIVLRLNSSLSSKKLICLMKS